MCVVIQITFWNSPTISGCIYCKQLYPVSPGYAWKNCFSR